MGWTIGLSFFGGMAMVAVGCVFGEIYEGDTGDSKHLHLCNLFAFGGMSILSAPHLTALVAAYAFGVNPYLP